jgi:hypothetical protein
VFIRLTEYHTGNTLLINAVEIQYILKLGNHCQIYTSSTKRECITVEETMCEVAVSIMDTGILVDPKIFSEI